MSDVLTTEEFNRCWKEYGERIHRRLWKNNKKCRYCGIRIPDRHLAILDLLVPRSRGGQPVDSNLTLACGACYSAKEK
ncbi:MAG: HNH endonuclease [Planctomycetaceae bacterium]